MAENGLVSKLEQLTLHHEDIEDTDSHNWTLNLAYEEDRREKGLLCEEVTDLNTHTDQHVTNESYSTATADYLQVEYMSQHVISEEKEDVLDEKKTQCHDIINIEDKSLNISNVVKIFINDLLEQIEDKQYLSTTGLVYDKRMTKYHAIGYHPERPERISSMYRRLCDEGLVEQCALIKPRYATSDELLSKHSSKHITFINSIKDREFDELRELGGVYDSIYFHPAVTEAALLAAGCTLALMEEVILGNVLNGAAVIRPPGHHALTHCSMGFCHFNNVAVGAQVAIEKFKLNRVLIVDWDVHYGNGTHKMFEHDPRVLFFSLHRYDHGSFWPCDQQANFNAVGIGEGEGYNIHVAWNEGMMGDAEYLLAFEKLLLPIAAEYNPELVLVSCGFDSGSGDPLGGCNVTPAGYAHMTQKLMSFAGGKLILLLEGGYNLDTISQSMAACVSTLLKHSPPPLNLQDLKTEGVKSVRDTFLIMQKYWPSLVNENFDQYFDSNSNSTLSSTNEES